MNNRKIFAIIGIITAAIFGLMWLQLDLVSTSIRVNEAKFDTQIFESLNRVVERLEKEEEYEAEKYINGYTAEYISNDNQNSLSSKIKNLRISNTSLPLKQEEPGGLLNGRPFGKSFYNTRNPDEPLIERLDLGRLDDFLRQELSDQGIEAAYSYGVYSKMEGRFIISNGREVNNGDYTASSFLDINGSDYHVNLFKGDVESPGSLMVYFPTKKALLWSSLLLNFIGAGLCILLILACFGYTIYIIFRQKQVSEMKTDFINNMTHEFKTPIATISLAADSITSTRIAGDPKKVSRFANIIKQENKRMNSQVEKVLQMAQIDKRDFNLRITDVNLHDVIRQAVENIELQVDKKNGVVKKDLKATQSTVQGDMTHLSNMINNLLDNANKYSPETPEITVLTRDIAGGVEVTIRDRGIGMNSEARKHIFDKFYRVHTGNLHDVKGFGLGLSYVKAMITAHKGSIDVKSELGKGSSFILSFPHRQADND